MFIAHAQPESHTERLVREGLDWAKPVYTLDLPKNSHLLALGARPLDVRGAFLGG